MFEIFDKLTMALYGNPLMAVLAAFLWGILSIILSPCHLASIPIVVAFINEQKQISTKKAFYISAMFSLGIMITLLITGIVISFTGMILGNVDFILQMLVIILLVLVGLYFLGIISLPDLGTRKDHRITKRPYLSGLTLGLVFGIALGPCAFAFMAPIIGIVLQSITTHFWFCISLMLAYIIGHCGVLILVGTSTELVKKYLSWDVASSGTRIIRKVCGILIILGALISLVKLF